MSFLIRNIDSVNVEIGDLGITILPGNNHDLSEEAPNSIKTSDDLSAKISGGQVRVLDPLDGTTQLSIADSLTCVSLANDPHYRIRGGTLNQLDDVDIFGSPTEGFVLFYNETSGNFEISAVQDIDGGSLTLASAADTTPATLSEKLIEGYGLNFVINNPGANETITLVTDTGELDDIYVNESGDTMSGNLNMDGVEIRIHRPTAAGDYWSLGFSAAGIPQIGRSSNAGAMRIFPDAVNPQWLFGSDAAGTLATYIDCDNNGELRLNTLHTGTVVIGDGGLEPETPGTTPIGGASTRFGDAYLSDVDAINGTFSNQLIVGDQTPPADTFTLTGPSNGNGWLLKPPDGNSQDSPYFAIRAFNSTGGPVDMNFKTNVNPDNSYEFEISDTNGVPRMYVKHDGEVRIHAFGAGIVKSDATGILSVETENTGFNLDVGTTAGTVAAGDHTHPASDIVSGTFADARISESSVTQHEGAINHDNLLNFVTNEHIDHTAVTLTAGNGMTGGGDISASRTFNVVGVNSIVANADDIQLVNDAASPGNSQLYGTNSSGVRGWYPQNVVGDLPTCQVRRSADFTIPTTWTDIPFDITDIENDANTIEHNNTNTDRIDIKEKGVYLITYQVSVDADAGEETFDFRVRENDLTVISGSLRQVSEDDEINGVGNVFVAALGIGDFITFQVQASGTGNVLIAESTYTVTKLKGVKGDKGDVGSGSSITVEDEGTGVTGGPYDTLNFTGTGVTATNAGGGTADITIPGYTLKQYHHAHCGTTTQTLTTSFVTLILNSIIRSDTIYANSNGQITVSNTGWYKVTYDVSGDATGGRSSMECLLELNGTLVPGSYAYGYHRSSTSGENTASATVLVSITSGQVLRVRVREINGAVVTKANASRITIEQIDSP